MGYTPITPKFIFKKSLLYIAFYFFPLAYCYGHIPIDRSNRAKAIESVNKAGDQIKKYNRSICISPEGTRSHGELLEFKKGPFHLALSAGITVVPVCIFNNYPLWPKGQLFPFTGEVRLRFLDPIHPKKGEDVDSLSQRVRQAMLKEFENRPRIPSRSEDITWAILFLAIVGAICFAIFV
eukprot:TRINITY_DN4797_c0_g1_i1.p1 TRINITY_DN4797_c0_g1~~TRINITY_DN4797_c0_g1_i1.p1  ORF type:complete len:180 (+),score=48.18 TRINITY_DN4797_c0_g1_i1:438-977(+)